MMSYADLSTFQEGGTMRGKNPININQENIPAAHILVYLQGFSWRIHVWK